MTGHDSTTRKLTVVSAGLGSPSSTRLLADRLAQSTTEQLAGAGISVSTTTIELRDHAMAIAANLVNGFAGPDLEAAIQALTRADGAILVTPIFNASFSGLFKSFIDVIEQGALDGLAVAIGATGGSERHSLALDYAIRPVLSYHRAVVVPTGVFAATSDWGAVDGGGLPSRMRRAAGELAALMRNSTRGDQVLDPFALPVGFNPAG